MDGQIPTPDQAQPSGNDAPNFQELSSTLAQIKQLEAVYIQAKELQALLAKLEEKQLDVSGVHDWKTIDRYMNDLESKGPLFRLYETGRTYASIFGNPSFYQWDSPQRENQMALVKAASKAVKDYKKMKKAGVFKTPKEEHEAKVEAYSLWAAALNASDANGLGPRRGCYRDWY